MSEITQNTKKTCRIDVFNRLHIRFYNILASFSKIRGLLQNDQNIPTTCRKTCPHKMDYKQQNQHSNIRWDLFLCSKYHHIYIKMKVKAIFHYSWSTVRSIVVENFDRVFPHILVLVIFPTSKRVVAHSFWVREMIHHSNWSLWKYKQLVSFFNLILDFL